MTQHFADALLTMCEAKQSRLVVGLDPHPAMLPMHLLEKHQTNGEGDHRQAMAATITEFNLAIIRAVAEYAVAVKPQLSLYEPWGPAGMDAYEKTVAAAHTEGLLVIADGKRNDIGSSAEGYAAAYLGAAPGADANTQPWEADALTINPYLGSDGISPFMLRSSRGKGAFVLVRTSNPSAAQIQNLVIGATPLFLKVAELVRIWGAETIGEQGYSALGAVVGATDPKAARALRCAMPNTIFLVPGFGAQGGSAQDVAAAFHRDGRGAIVNSSREVIFAYKRTGEYRLYASAAREAARIAKTSINDALCS